VRSDEDEGPPLGLEAAAMEALVAPVAGGFSADGPVESSGPVCWICARFGISEFSVPRASEVCACNGCGFSPSAAAALSASEVAQATSKRKIMVVMGSLLSPVKSREDLFRDPGHLGWSKAHSQKLDDRRA
jgi:hypothetical protein